ncbi:hypothetical protein JRC49_10220 [Clostridiales bacterium FE2011]|nr:hypothetical protein JRC49_10220 [Clostridiales bacterium FE2011]
MKAKVKVIICFICIILFFTIAGSSIHYWLLPKVKLINPRTGSLKCYADILDVDIRSENKISIAPPKVIDVLSPIYINEEARSIQEEEVLMRYDISSIEDELIVVEEQYAQAKDDLLSFSQAYRKEVLQLQKECEGIKKEKEEGDQLSKQDVDELELRYEFIQERLQLMENEGIYQGTTYDILQYKLDQIEMKRDELKNIKDNNGEIRSPISGHLLGWKGNAWEIIPSDSTLQFVIWLDVSVEELESVINPLIIVDDLEKRVSIEIDSMKQSAEGTEVMFAVSNEDENFPLLLSDTLKLEYLSPASGLLVPSYAFVSDSCLYIAENIWNGNKRIDRARLIEVKVIPGNEQYWIVTDGLIDSANIISNWDRELNDGCEIAIEP